MSSSRSAERLEKKLQNALRECQKKPENKRCADCRERLPQWVVTDFNTFVCTACSGIHREFSHRVKSISLATFSENEVAGVKAGGNEVNNELYMARYRPGHDLPEPEGGRAEKHREFIRTKYVDKRWYATPEDLEKDAQREKEREAARAKRDADRGKRDSASGGRGAVPKKPERPSGVSAERARRGSLDRGLRKVDPLKAVGVAAAVKPPPAPKKQVDLLDFLSDGPAPAPGPSLGPVQVQVPRPAQQWAAFSEGESATGAIAPPPAPPATGGTPGIASWTAFGDAPAASQQQQQPPQQKAPQQAPNFAFQDGSTTQAQPASGSTFPAFSFSTNFPATANADMGQQQKQQQQPWSQQQVSTVPAPAGLPQAGFPQTGSHGQQPQPPQHRAAFGAQATPSGGLSGTLPTVATLRPPPSPNATLFQAKPQPQPQPQQGFVQSGGDFTMSGARMSVPSTPVQQPQQVGVFSSGSPAVSGGAAGGFLNGGNAGTGFATSFEGLSLSSPAAGGVVTQQGGQGFPPHGHQRSRSQQGAVFSQGAGQPQAPYNPGAGQLQHSVFFGGGITPQQTPAQQPQQQAFAAFGQQPQFHQHPVGLPQYPQQQQQPQLQPHFQGPPGNSQGMQQQQQQQQFPQYPSPYQQQAAEGIGMGPSGPVQPPPAAGVDPFAELAEGGGTGEGATGNGSSQEPPFRKGDEVLYIRGSDPPLEGVIQKVHAEEYPPYYTVLISVTGREKNTDAAHLKHKKEGKEGVSNGRGHQNGQQRAGPDAFASLGADAWGSTSTGATVVAAAPVRPQAGPQQPQVAPQQAGPHHATKQPTLAQGKEAMSSAGVGMAGGGGNPFKGIESPGLTAGTGVATGAAEQAGENPFDMF